MRHTQAECAAELTDLIGRQISQSRVSQLENGNIHRPADDLMEAVETYCRRVDSQPEVGLKPSGSDNEAFDSLVRVIVDEPLLGPRQEALVRAVTARFASGPALSRSDLEALVAVASVLGLRWSP
jgi:hypothetical protein